MSVMDYVIEAILGALIALIGWVVREIKKDVDALGSRDLQLLEKVNKIEVLVAGNYVSRAELNTTMTSMLTEIRAIHAKLDTKADKH
jgi:hypothetical protein